MATGANANTWGTNTNNNLDVIDAFSAGYLSKSVAGSSNITLTTANASDTAEASNKVIELTGALTGDIVVFIPAVESNYTFFNNTTGSQTLTIAATGHQANGTLITQGAHTTVYCDGASNYNVEISSSTDAAALNAGTLADARFPATLPAASGANLTTLNASELDSGTVPDARFPATLPAADGSALTALNATNIASGTLADARLPTVPTTKGGTGLTSVGTTGQVLTVTSPGALAFQDAAGGGIGGSTTTTFNAPGTFTAAAGTQLISIEVIGGGGGGGGAQGGSSGGTGQSSTFGSFATANGGSGGSMGGGGGGGGGSATGNIPGSYSKGGSGTSGRNSPGQTPTPGGGAGGTASGGSLSAGNGGTGGRGNLFNISSGGGGGGAGVAFQILGGPQYSPAGQPVTVGSGGPGGGGMSQANPGSTGQAGKVTVVEYVS
jgi:hypothetical protein